MNAKTPEALKAEIQLFCQKEAFDGSDILLADGLEEAFVGIGSQHGDTPVAIYDYSRCVQIVIKQICDTTGREPSVEVNDEAVDHMEDTVLSGWMGKTAPIFMSSWESLGEEKP